MTKTAQERAAKNHVAQYEKSTDTELYHVYKSCSVFKGRAFESIRDEMARLSGWGLRIISHNANIFTCGYLYADPDTGVIRFVYHTPTYRAEIDY